MVAIGCVFDFDSDVIQDTICGAPDLPSAYQGPAHTQVRNFSLPSYCDSLTPMRRDPHVALVQGNENHNRNSPVLKDLPPVPKDPQWTNPHAESVYRHLYIVAQIMSYVRFLQ